MLVKGTRGTLTRRDLKNVEAEELATAVSAAPDARRGLTQTSRQRRSQAFQIASLLGVQIAVSLLSGCGRSADFADALSSDGGLESVRSVAVTPAQDMRRLCPFIETTVYWSNDANSKFQRMLTEGSIFQILEISPQKPTWYKIQADGAIGWINAQPLNGKSIVCELPKTYYICTSGASFRFSNSIGDDSNIIRIFEEGEGVNIFGGDSRLNFLAVKDRFGKEGFVLPQNICAGDSHAFKGIFTGWVHPFADRDEGVCTSVFGWRRDPVTGYPRAFHGGIDFAAPTGTLVTPVDDGEVIFAGPYGGYGNAVVVLHSRSGKSIKSIYGHLSAIAARVGDQVRAPGRGSAGTIIGRVGSTGKSTGPHLHLEARTLDNEQINPITFFRISLGCG